MGGSRDGEPEDHPSKPCPFCEPATERLVFSTPEFAAIRDAYPVTEGHLLIVPRRHVARWDELTKGERDALHSGVERGRFLLRGQVDPDAFNVGYNDGVAAGQTIPHFHIHIIPRRAGDVANPRGGVRNVIPTMGDYVPASESPPNLGLLSRTPHRLTLISGGEDPLFPHLVRHIDDADAVDIAVAFIMESGARLLIPHLRDMLSRGGRLRFVTGDYLEVTDAAPHRVGDRLDAAVRAGASHSA